jgi:hypothetical protein
MAIAASGAVSFSDLRTEFVGGSSAISLSDLYRGGSNILSNAGDNPSTNLAASVPTSGAIDIQDFYSTTKGFKNTVSNSTTNVDADALFGDDYDVNYPKIIDINSGVTIGGSGDDAIDIPSGLAGTLTINNAGNILGAGGAAGAAGGNGINCASSGVTINNTGLLAGGGGGGGNGGDGGAGEVNNTADWSGREPAASWTNGSASVGYYWNIGSYHVLISGGTTTIMWGSNIGSASGSPSFVRIGNNEYHRGPHRGSSKYEIYRQAKTATSAGAGGAGGVGQGYNQTNASGSNGSAGGTGAGTGGVGGAGSTYAVAGVAGSSGANGNSYSSGTGSAGNAGGAAGAAVTGTSVTMNNTGTIHGAVA